jgi:peptide-methionine (R)-S-oxide reductase
MRWLDVLNYARNGNPAPDKRVEKSEEEWKALLTAEEFHITRKKGTERAWTGEYCEAHDPGLYACRCCGTLLFDSSEKFESGTGWPSFTIPVKDNVIKYEKDTSYGMTRIEVMCNVCDGHLGHVFPDGPPPTGLRYCINSASIRLVDQTKVSHV